jgi:hypothetical protein
MEFTVYIPKPNTYSNKTIKKGSAVIKSKLVDESMVKVYYEGNIYNAQNIRTYEDRCMLAAGRARDNYPTTAFMVVPTHDLIDAGTYCITDNTVSINDDVLDLYTDWVV